MMTTQKQVRAAFWADTAFPNGITKRKKSTGEYSDDAYMAFADYVDALVRNGEITEALAQRVTL